MDMNVNKTKTPLYYQIYDYFKNKIRAEELKEGEGLRYNKITMNSQSTSAGAPETLEACAKTMTTQ